MQYNRLGHSDLTVSRICIGTMTFGDRVDQAEAARCCDLALERGVNFFDTADIYPPGPGLAGKSEKMLGQRQLHPARHEQRCRRLADGVHRGV